MSIYSEVRRQIESLTPDEQLLLLEELAVLVRRQVTTQLQSKNQELSRQNLQKWQGFLPKRVDPLEFQLNLRREWDE